jgi:eukaryotic-like serine/threonine-protein kinase
MGTVYRALDRQLDREVALKLLRDTLTSGLDARLLREARIIGRLEHPGNVPVHDIGCSEDGRAFYVMKLVDGERLDRYASTGIGLDAALRLFERICDTVAFAHARGVIHRDLKPANVMVGSFGEVLVLDWGLAKAVDAADPTVSVVQPAPAIDTAHGSILGTPGFMAPEQASGRTTNVDVRADVYGLGGVLAALTGSPPRPVAAICARARAEDPVDRYRDVPALAADIRRYVSGGAVEAYAEPLIERLARIAAPYRAAMLLVGTYLVLRLLLLVAAGF